MVLEITIASVISFVTMTTLLFIYAMFDIRTRLVPNRITSGGGVIGSAIVVLTGHLIDQALLHLSAIMFMLVVSYLLFRVGSFGGADIKAAVTVAIVSPGIEFGVWSDPILEGVLGSGLLLMAVLLGGYFISRYRREEKKRATPLIPIILAAYLILQLFAVIL